jgi:hypothetical protein
MTLKVLKGLISSIIYKNNIDVTYFSSIKSVKYLKFVIYLQLLFEGLALVSHIKPYVLYVSAKK